MAERPDPRKDFSSSKGQPLAPQSFGFGSPCFLFSFSLLQRDLFKRRSSFRGVILGCADFKNSDWLKNIEQAIGMLKDEFRVILRWKFDNRIGPRIEANMVHTVTVTFKILLTISTLGLRKEEKEL